jgi:hypothetical protein
VTIIVDESTEKTIICFTDVACMAVLRVKLNEMDVFGPLRQLVHIIQKMVKHVPVDDVYDVHDVTG